MLGAPYDLVGQFLLSHSEPHLPEGWHLRQRRGWCLGSHKKLPVIDLLARDGSHIGWLLGYAVHPDARLVSATVRLPCEPAAPRSFEDSLYAMGGRFVAIYLAADAARTYLDPCGTMGLVFCPSQGIAASSPNLIPPSAETGEDRELTETIGTPERDGWYPFGLTPRRGVERLLPNHMLDLKTWSTTRHWPSIEDLQATTDTEAAVGEIAANLDRQIGAVARAAPTYMSLTAGRHTRMLLACGRQYLERISFFTLPLPKDSTADVDCQIASHLARRVGLTYVPLRWEEPTPQELDAWGYRVGRCVGGRTWRTVRTLRQLRPSRGILSGIVGSIGQASYRRWTDFEDRAASCTDLLQRIHMPAVPALIQRAERWLETLPQRGILTAVDFLHLEQKHGCWAGPQEYGHVDSAFIMSPYCHRRIVRRILGLPADYRWRDALTRDLIQSRWPELLEVPFNRPIGLKRGLQLGRQAFRRTLDAIFG